MKSVGSNLNMSTPLDSPQAEFPQPGVDFNGYPQNADLEMLAKHHPEFRFIVRDAVQVRVDDPLDCEHIATDTDEGRQAWVWWIRVEPTGQDAIFRPDGHYGTYLRDPHYLLADQVSLAIAVERRGEVLLNPDLDFAVDYRHVPVSDAMLEDLTPEEHGAYMAQIAYMNKTIHHQPLRLRGLEPSVISHIIADREDALENDQDDYYDDDNEIATDDIEHSSLMPTESLAHEGARLRARELRRQWWIDKSVHPLDPDAPLEILQRMIGGEWLGQLDGFWYGIGNVITDTEVATALGMDVSEMEVSLGHHTDAQRTICLPIVTVSTDGATNILDGYLVRSTWKPTPGWYKLLSPEDIATMFDVAHQQIVLDILRDQMQNSVSLFDDDDVFAKDVAELLAQFDRQNDVDTTHEGRFGPDHGLGL